MFYKYRGEYSLVVLIASYVSPANRVIWLPRRAALIGNITVEMSVEKKIIARQRDAFPGCLRRVSRHAHISAMYREDLEKWTNQKGRKRRSKARDITCGY